MDIAHIVDKLVSIYGEGGILPTADQWKMFLENPHSGKIVLHQFVKLRSAYLGGRQFPQELIRYSEISLRILADLGGRTIYSGNFESVWIGADELWDMVGIMEFPNRNALVEMFLNADYIEGHRHRHVAVERHKTLISHPLIP